MAHALQSVLAAEAKRRTTSRARVIPLTWTQASDTTYILPYRRDIAVRWENLKYVVAVAVRRLPGLDIVVAHQAAEPDPGLVAWVGTVPGCRVVFQRNAGPFDRGWGFNNVLLHHGCRPLVIMGDVDMPLETNVTRLLGELERGDVDFVSPYHRLFKLSQESSNVVRSASLEAAVDGLLLEANSHMYTFAGGVLLARREAMLRVGPWFEVGHYGHEDHTLDIILESRCPLRCRVDHCIYHHLWHPKNFTAEDTAAREQDTEHLMRHMLGCTLGHFLHPMRPFTNACGLHEVKSSFWTLFERQRAGHPTKYDPTAQPSAGLAGDESKEPLPRAGCGTRAPSRSRARRRQRRQRYGIAPNGAT